MSLLVTGTDTGVGKTVVAAALILALRERGVRAVGFKPVETGSDRPADSEVLAQASDVDEPLARPLLRLPEALAPAVAAERAGQRFDPAEAERRVTALRGNGYAIVVEGAGGLLAPLAWGCDVAVLAARLGMEAVVVARAGLGTLNHTALTVEALDRRGISVCGIVLNGRGDPPDLAEQTNPEALARMLPGRRIVVLPRLGGAPLELARRLAPTLAPLLIPGSKDDSDRRPSAPRG